MNEDQRTLGLSVEVSGCAGKCIHCWAQGRPYPQIKLGDIERILEEGARFCQSQGLKFSPYPMHEVLMHTDALRVLQLFDTYCHPIDPITTPGPALALREDWEELLSGAKDLGTTALWFAFHGLDEIQDRAIGRKGAFAEAITAIERGKSAGFRCGANVFITTDNLHQIPQMMGLFSSVGLDSLSIEPAGYRPHPRGREYYSLRPELAQLIPYAGMFAEESSWHKEAWRDLDKCTEAYYVDQALSNQGSEEVKWSYFNPNATELVCRNNLDLHTGYAGTYGPLHGNLGRDDMQATFGKALKAGPLRFERLYFPEGDIPPVPELARRWGDPKGQRVYMSAVDVRLRWLDLELGGAVK